MALSLRRDFDAEHLPFYLVAISYVLVLLSYPMPPSPGVVEAVMGVGLSAACIAMFARASRLQQQDYRWLVACLIAGGLLVVLPGIHGLSHGIGFSKVARDLFPMAFLAVLVPLTAYCASTVQRTGAAGILLASILCVGAISPVEFIIGMHDEYGSMEVLSQGLDKSYSEPANLQFAEATMEAPAAPAVSPAAPVVSPPATSQQTVANSFSVRALHIFEPAVTFATIYCGCLFLLMLTQKRILVACLYLAVAATALYGLITLRLRAPVGLFVVAQIYFLYHLASGIKEPKIRLKIAVAALIAGAAIVFVLRDMLWGLWLKQTLVGSNGKLAEWQAVFGTLGNSWDNLLLGIGWGGEFVPNYQLQPVRFTHSLFSFVLLKAGIVGLTLFALIYGRLIGRLIGQLRRSALEHTQLAVLLAGAAVVAIGLSFQPTYKMLGFSVILGLLFAATSGPSGVQRQNGQS